jgi:hypothetical protein
MQKLIWLLKVSIVIFLFSEVLYPLEGNCQNAPPPPPEQRGLSGNAGPMSSDSPIGNGTWILFTLMTLYKTRQYVISGKKFFNSNDT